MFKIINSAGKPEPELVYARKDEIDRLHDEIERLRALLLQAIPHIEGSQNTTSLDSYQAAEDLLGNIRSALAIEQSKPSA